MKPAIPTLVLAAALSTSLYGALTAAPIDAPLAAMTDAAPPSEPAPKAPALLLASGDDDGVWRLLDWDDDDDDDDHHRRKGHDHDDDDDDDDDDDRAAAPAGSPAPAGTAEPPANGLFTPGAKPKVQTN